MKTRIVYRLRLGCGLGLKVGLEDVQQWTWLYLHHTVPRRCTSSQCKFGYGTFCVSDEWTVVSVLVVDWNSSLANNRIIVVSKCRIMTQEHLSC